MGNQGVRLNLVFGKEIKGENQRDKRKILGKREGTFALLDPEKLREKKPERKEKKGEEERAKPKPKQHHFD